VLSYRHGFHAGNFADVHKHIILALLLDCLKRKSSPFCYIDTHAGCGLYDLQSEFAQKKLEYETGIGRLWSLTDIPDNVGAFLDVVRMVNPGAVCRDNNLRFYPGSPLIAQQLLRKDDRMFLLELHTSELPLLKAQFSSDKRVSVHHRDAWEGLLALIPPQEKRGLVLIDPSYDSKGSFSGLTRAVIRAWHKWPTAVYAVWYPVQKQLPIPQFHYELRQAGIEEILVSEFNTVAPVAPARMTGSGMLIINPPWQSDQPIAEITRWLAGVLDRGAHEKPRCEWLVTGTDQK